MAYFKTFSVDTTNIFPIANTTTGGQLVTEFNLKSREGVSYHESVKYNCGPSYVHAEEDYKVSSQKPVGDFFPDTTEVSTSVIQIAPGRGVIDGHFVENLAPMTIDLARENKKLYAEGETLIGGDLAIGLKVMYSTEQTMAGAVMKEKEGVFEGVQVVILPVDEVMLPTTRKTVNGELIDCGLLENKDKVNMHLLLATFTFFNGNISNIVNNYPEKCQMLPAVRIGEIDSIISDEYVRRSYLDEAKIYAFAGKGVNSTDGGRGTATGLDTWCDVTDALVSWTGKVELTTEKPDLKTAAFIADKNGVYMHLPHKQVEGAGYTLHNKSGGVLYFKPTKIELPTADYANGTSGVVNKAYTDSIKDELQELKDVNLMHMTNGKLIAYIDTINSVDELPPLNPNWKPGDYILVGKDYSMIEDAVDPNQSAPSTMYVILPGFVTQISSNGIQNKPAPSGVELANAVLEEDETTEDLKNPIDTCEYWNLTDGDGKYIYHGRKNIDYFTLHCTKESGTEDNYYYKVQNTDNSISYSNPILITPQIPFATEQMVGGFLNVPENTRDAGYVYLDETGHLRLLDYALLRSGTLAYQLGEDYATPAGLDIEAIQSYLDEYVNQRIAFPNANQIQNAENPNIIDITIDITPSESDEGAEPDTGDQVLNIYDIDSRFNTAIRINILGNASSSVTINVSDCARVMINPIIEGTPNINLYRSNLYYDATVLNTLQTIADMGLWYEKLHESDPDLTVEGMTVRLVRNPSEYNSDYSIAASEFWSEDNVNDFHFKVALQSISFSSSGYLTGCTVLVANDTTANVVNTGKFVIHWEDFKLPQGTLMYPEKRFQCPIKVTGQFIHGYKSNDTTNPSYCIQNTSFSLKSQYYDDSIEFVENADDNISYGLHTGEAAFLVDAFLVKDADAKDIDVWTKGEYHVFSGKIIH